MIKNRVIHWLIIASLGVRAGLEPGGGGQYCPPNLLKALKQKPF